MKRLWVALCLVAGLGCVSDTDRAQWNAALQDANGANMKMRSDTSRLNESADLPSLRPRD